MYYSFLVRRVHCRGGTVEVAKSRSRGGTVEAGMADFVPFTWSVVIPVKVLNKAKSRLAGLGAGRRRELALAMSADTVAAAVDCPRVAHVIVVTDDPDAHNVLEKIGAEIIEDEPRDGLNAALRHGAAYARQTWPTDGLAALSADLPALRPAELATALAEAERWPNSFVPDATGEGTTLYTARPDTSFIPMFGEKSRDRHAAAGAVEVGLTGLPGLRRDVDTPADLLAAVLIGLGPRTARYAPRDR
jgi:2-phospho-L-lactate/phosphoenolpyruvate guanylyltransferase